jgi:hypothetical protein
MLLVGDDPMWDGRNRNKEIAMQVEITVTVNGQVVREQAQQVEGTLEQMEEAIDAMTRRVACAALQASVEAVAPPRPLFRKTAANSATKGTKPAP